MLQQANVSGASAGKLIGGSGASGASGGYLTRPVNPAGPICVVVPAFVEHLGNPSCPDRPRKPNTPR